MLLCFKPTILCPTLWLSAVNYQEALFFLPADSLLGSTNRGRQEAGRGRRNFYPSLFSAASSVHNWWQLTGPAASGLQPVSSPTERQAKPAPQAQCFCSSYTPPLNSWISALQGFLSFPGFFLAHFLQLQGWWQLPASPTSVIPQNFLLPLFTQYNFFNFPRSNHWHGFCAFSGPTDYNVPQAWESECLGSNSGSNPT